MLSLFWLALRLSVGARLRPALPLLLDGAALFAGWSVFLGLTARPILSSLIIAALGIGLIVVDRVKRAVLREPIVFADRAELRELVLHPRLYLPAAGTGRVLAGAGALLLLGVFLVWLEPPLWGLRALPPLIAAAGLIACFRLPVSRALLPQVCTLYERQAPTRDPARDLARFGPLACLVMHATLARAERPRWQAGRAPRQTATRRASPGIVVLVQAESFFDVGLLSPTLTTQVLPRFDDCRRRSVQHGRFSVPCWGANTIRTEFSVLTGIPATQLGLDRFNPYAAIRRMPIDSIAWRARQAGWRTVCVHPFDLDFYRRRRVLPCLGFETLIGPEAFGRPHPGDLYVDDDAVADRVAALVDTARAEGSGLLVFAITMGGHSPWQPPIQAGDAVALPPSLRGSSESRALANFLYRARRSDAALTRLQAALEPCGPDGLLAVYGDHQPSFPQTFAALNCTDERTDYLLWRATHPDQHGPSRRCDLAAHELGAALLSEAGLDAVGLGWAGSSELIDQETNGLDGTGPERYSAA